MMCTRCGISDERILLKHHIDRNRKNNDIKNLQTLCYNCHKLAHLEIKMELKNNQAFIYYSKFPNWFDVFLKSPVELPFELFLIMACRRYSSVFADGICKENQISGLHIYKRDLEDFLGIKNE